ncbi:MAG: metallophosphoesterase [Clostridiales bacterium]|nr:metallophosphoesterase [Clostridiales bacterium]
MRRGKRWGWLLVMFLAVLLLFGLDQRLSTRVYRVETDKLTAPVRLAVIADYHGCSYGPDAADLVLAVADLCPDAVLLVGDIFDDVLPWDSSAALLRSLAERYPCYYVTGNHEHWTKRIDEIEQIVTEAGAVVLERQCVELVVNGQRLNLCGIPDPYAGVATEAALQCVVEDIHQPGYTVLLAHRPELIGKYASTGRFDLVVSGHAHGGQVRIPLLINGLYAPNQGIFPRYAGGLYTVEDTTMIVSRGLARESTSFPRIFNRPELLLIEVTPATK